MALQPSRINNITPLGVHSGSLTTGVQAFSCSVLAIDLWTGICRAGSHFPDRQILITALYVDEMFCFVV